MDFIVLWWAVMIQIMVWGLYGSIRNHYVFKFRMNLLENDYKNYRKLVTYDEMIMSFKKLTVENFCK